MDLQALVAELFEARRPDEAVRAAAAARARALHTETDGRTFPSLSGNCFRCD